MRVFKYKKYSKDAVISEGDSTEDFHGMLKDLCSGHEKMIQLLRGYIEQIGNTKDFGSEDLLVGILRNHEKNLWMLNSHFERGK